MAEHACDRQLVLHRECLSHLGLSRPRALRLPLRLRLATAGRSTASAAASARPLQSTTPVERVLRETMADTSHQDLGRKKPSEAEPLLPQASTSAPAAERPRTVRHHRRALSGRSARSGISGQISFGPSYNPSIYPAVNDPFTRQAKQAADGRARSRFLKALLFGIGLWIVIGLVFGWAGLHRAGWGQGSNRVDYGAKPSVPRSDGRAVWCAKFDTPQSIAGEWRMPGKTLRSEASISIPFADRDRFFIHGQGSFAKGRISIGTTDSEDIQIQLAALTNDEALIDLMTVCHVSDRPAQTLNHSQTDQLSRGGQNVGLGVYTPTPEVGPYPDSDLEFTIQVNLPKNVALIRKLSVHTDLFSLAATDLGAFLIAEVDITTSVAPIRIDRLVGESITIRTNNGHIEGAFKISKTLNLATTNGAIVADVALALPIEAGRNASISAFDAPSVSVDAATINGAVTVKYVEHPVDLKLLSYVKSTNGRAHVEHAPAYEGSFVVETTWGSADVLGPLSDQDPSGRARVRQKLVKSNRDELGFRHISGLVWWGDKDAEPGVDKDAEPGADKDAEPGANNAALGHSRVKTTLGSARAIFQ